MWYDERWDSGFELELHLPFSPSPSDPHLRMPLKLHKPFIECNLMDLRCVCARYDGIFDLVRFSRKAWSISRVLGPLFVLYGLLIGKFIPPCIIDMLKGEVCRHDTGPTFHFCWGMWRLVSRRACLNHIIQEGVKHKYSTLTKFWFHLLPVCPGLFQMLLLWYMKRWNQTYWWFNWYTAKKYPS